MICLIFQDEITFNFVSLGHKYWLITSLTCICSIFSKSICRDRKYTTWYDESEADFESRAFGRNGVFLPFIHTQKNMFLYDEWHCSGCLSLAIESSDISLCLLIFSVSVFSYFWVELYDSIIMIWLLVNSWWFVQVNLDFQTLFPDSWWYAGDSESCWGEQDNLVIKSLF